MNSHLKHCIHSSMMIEYTPASLPQPMELRAESWKAEGILTTLIVIAALIAKVCLMNEIWQLTKSM